MLPSQETTVKDVIPKAVADLQGAGYKLSTVASCLALSPYKSIGTASKRDATWVSLFHDIT